MLQYRQILTLYDDLRKTKVDKIAHEDSKRQVGVNKDVLEVKGLSWYGHVRRKDKNRRMS